VKKDDKPKTEMDSETKPMLGNLEAGPDPESILEGIEQKKRKYKPREKHAADNPAPARKVNEKYYSPETWSKVIDFIPFKILKIVTKFPGWELEEDVKKELGEALSVVVKEFLPDVVEDKWIALGIFGVLLGTTVVGKGLEWQSYQKMMKRKPELNPTMPGIQTERKSNQ
jgi:hypothetical protein